MDSSDQHLHLVRNIQQALEENLFQVSYMPIMDTSSPDTPIFSVSMSMKTDKGGLVPYQSLRRLANEAELNFKLDRWLVTKAQEDLKTLHHVQPGGLLFIPQSLATLTAKDYPSWLARQQELHEATGKGLILSFRLAEMSKNIRNARRLIKDLKALNIASCLNRFPENPIALKLLEVLQTEYIEISQRLLNANDKIIDQLDTSIHQMGSKILLSGIDKPDSLNLSWSNDADLISGNYLHSATDNLAFEFPPVIV